MIYLLPFLLTGSIFATEIKNSYCVESDTVKASLFDKKSGDFEVLKLPSNRSSYQVPSIKIKKIFKEHNISIEDNSNGIVKFKKNCPKPATFKEERAYLGKKFQDKYENIEIESIHIEPTVSFEKKGWKLEKINLKESNFRNKEGVVKAFYSKNSKEKMHYLRYRIKAYIYILKTTKDLKNGQTLKESDYRMNKIKFDRLPLHVITSDLKENYKLKSYIKKDSILTYNRLKIKKMFQKGSHIKAILQEGALILELDAKLLQDANPGDTLKIKTSSGRIFRAKINKNKTAKILD